MENCNYLYYCIDNSIVNHKRELFYYIFSYMFVSNWKRFWVLLDILKTKVNLLKVNIGNFRAVFEIKLI